MFEKDVETSENFEWEPPGGKEPAGEVLIFLKICKKKIEYYQPSLVLFILA